MIYVTWTDPETGQREMRTFSTPDGTGKLRRRLKRRGIPFQSGWAADAAVVASVRTLRSQWQPDPRVWSAFRRPAGGDAA